jgi:Zn-finger nucleic acid-binding protein
VLAPVDYEHVQIQVCPSCQGEWLSAGELERIVEHHDEIFTPEEIASMEALNTEKFTAEVLNQDELNCPQCEDVRMEHFNYGDTSGLILHKCGTCRGIWTDKDQLKKVEMLVDGWKQCLNQDSVTYGPLLRKIEMEEQKEMDQNVSISRIGFVNSILRRFCE